MAAVPEHVLGYALRTGQLVRLFHGVYADPEAVDQRTRMLAAVRYSRGRAALSHTSALAVWGLWQPDADEPIHLTTSATDRFTGAGLVIHRATGFTMGAPDTLVRKGLPVTGLDRSIVDSWPVIPADRRREPVIHAVTDRMTQPKRLRAVLDEQPHLGDRATLTRIVQLLELGCHSPLEIWGYEHVFSAPGMPVFRRQVPIQLEGRTVYLDVFAEDERVNFELDGRDGHTTQADRERDLKRDAALAAMGILVVRFTAHRLTHDAPAVRREILAILAARRAMR